MEKIHSLFDAEKVLLENGYTVLYTGKGNIFVYFIPSKGFGQIEEDAQGYMHVGSFFKKIGERQNDGFLFKTAKVITLKDLFDSVDYIPAEELGVAVERFSCIAEALSAIHSS